MTAKINALEAENERMRSDLQSVRADYSTLGTDRSEQERELTHLRLKIAVLEQDFKVKDEQLKRVADEMSFERDAKVGLLVSLMARCRLFDLCARCIYFCEILRAFPTRVFW